MRVYHFLNHKYGIQDLQRRRLKVSRIVDLNDPFEMAGPATRNRDLRAVFGASKSLFDFGMGLICFSKAWSNPVQWSHYADGHRGICLGFDVPAKLLKPVNYQDERVEIDISALKGGGIAGRREIEKLLTTKYTHWQYESEIRSFLSFTQCKSERGRYFLPFSNLLELKEVIVGHRCSMTRAELHGYLGTLGSTTAVIKARLAFQSFKVVRQQNAALW